MKPSWRGNNALKLLKKSLRPKTREVEAELIYSNGFSINGELVYYLADGDEVMIELTSEEESIGSSFFSLRGQDGE